MFQATDQILNVIGACFRIEVLQGSIAPECFGWLVELTAGRLGVAVEQL